MAKVYAPNDQYAGVSAGVRFTAGVAETENEAALEWFEAHGYRLERDAGGKKPKAAKPAE